MAANTTTRGRLRRLAELRPERGRVLSVFFNLDPSEFATPAARATEVNSVITAAAHKVDEAEELDHEERRALRADVERVREVLEGSGIASNGTHGLAVFACGPADLFEVVRLPHPIESRALVDDHPCVEPLVRTGSSERWCVLLVNRRTARIFTGEAGGLQEVDHIEGDTHRQHDQGGWSQANYQRGIEKEKDDHLKHTAEALMKHFKRQPFERLIVGGPREVVADFESKLHGYLKDRLAGRFEVDVERSTPEQVLEAAQPCFEELEERRETGALERMGEGGRAAVGLEDVLRALNERRLEALVVDERFAASGTCCPVCGWLGPGGVSACPVDGTELEELDDLAEAAVELTIQQSAEILAVRRHRDELDRRAGGIAALLRF
jgi:peptide chain release factor subunit 1